MADFRFEFGYGDRNAGIELACKLDKQLQWLVDGTGWLEEHYHVEAGDDADELAEEICQDLLSSVEEVDAALSDNFTRRFTRAVENEVIKAWARERAKLMAWSLLEWVEDAAAREEGKR